MNVTPPLFHSTADRTMIIRDLLTYAQPFSIRALNYGLDKPVKSPNPYEFEGESAEKYEAEVSRLEAMSFDNLWSERKSVLADLNRALSDAREAAFWFNQPPCIADVEYWSQMAHWTTEEAITLSLNRDPRRVGGLEVAAYRNVSKLAEDWHSRREIVSRSLQSRQLSDPTKPQNFVAWANRVGWELPEALTERLDTLGYEVDDWKAIADRWGATSEGLVAKIKSQEELIEALEAIARAHKESATSYLSQLKEHAAANQSLVDEVELLRAKAPDVAALNEKVGELTRELEAERANPAKSIALESVTTPQPLPKELSERRSYALQILLYAMAKEKFGYNPEKPAAQTKTKIRRAIEDLEGGLTRSERDIGNHLTAAKETVHSLIETFFAAPDGEEDDCIEEILREGQTRAQIEIDKNK